MRRTLTTAGLALASLLWASTASAAVVTAFFDGEIDEVVGYSPVPAGSLLSVELVGDDTTPGSPTMLPFGLSGGTAEQYDLTSMTIIAAALGINETSTNARFIVGDNVTYTDPLPAGATYPRTTFDILAAVGPLGSLTELQFLVAFSDDTFSGTQLTTAVALGLAQAPELAQYGRLVSENNSVRAPLGLRLLDIDDTPSNGGGGMTGGGGSTGGGMPGGGGTPTPAPIPLPAGAPLLLAGLGALAWLRRR